MVDIITKILTPADSFDLLTLDALKLAMGIPPNDLSQDVQLQEDISRYSDIVAILCNRIFGREEVRETVRCLQSRRYFLSHYPTAEDDIASVEAPRGNVLDPSAYEFEEKSGKIELFDSQSEPIVITYTGGYDLPEEAPPALKQVCEIMVLEGRALRRSFGTSGIRSISHKSARVMFFDPLVSGARAAAQFGYSINSINSLLSSYIRIEV
jgi:hypothetical protein